MTTGRFKEVFRPVVFPYLVTENNIKDRERQRKKDSVQRGGAGFPLSRE
jgi:hypothetical protein